MFRPPNRCACLCVRHFYPYEEFAHKKGCRIHRLENPDYSTVLRACDCSPCTCICGIYRPPKPLAAVVPTAKTVRVTVANILFSPPYTSFSTTLTTSTTTNLVVTTPATLTIPSSTLASTHPSSRALSSHLMPPPSFLRSTPSLSRYRVTVSSSRSPSFRFVGTYTSSRLATYTVSSTLASIPSQTVSRPDRPSTPPPTPSDATLPQPVVTHTTRAPSSSTPLRVRRSVVSRRILFVNESDDEDDSSLNEARTRSRSRSRSPNL